MQLASIAARVNASAQNIGARRLHTVVEKLLETVSFEAPEMDGVTVDIDVPFVREALAEVLEREDLERFIL